MTLLRTTRTVLATALGLVQAYEAALKNDPVYRAAFYANEGGKESAVLGRAALLPTVSGSYSGSKNQSDITTPAGTTHPDYISKSTVLQVRQPLVNLEGFARYKQGLLQSDYSATLLMSEQQQVALRVASAYLDVLLRQDQLQLAVAERDAYVERMKVNDRLFAKGEGTRTDMLETRARLDLAEAVVLESQDALASARTTLAGVIGGDPGELETMLPDAEVGNGTPRSYDEWRNLALQNNREIRARALAVDINQQEVNKARAGHYPRLDAVASISKSSSESINTINQDYKTRSVGFQLNVPLYAGGAVSASTRQAVANREKSRAEMQAEIDKAMVELRKDYDQLVSSTSRIAALRKAVESGKLLVTATEQSIKGGVRINLDVLDAQRQLSATVRDLAQARYMYLLADLKLRAVAGELSGDDIRRVGRLFR